MNFRIASMSMALVWVASGQLQGQDERHLKQAFEGRRITVLIDMPATSEGIDLVPGSKRPLDFEKYSGRLKKYGTAIKEGERSLITKIRVKDDIIEVQLGGGGYGTFGDVFSTALATNGADSGAAQQLKATNERTQRAASGSRFNLRFPNGITPDDLEPEAIIAVLAEYATFPAGLGAKKSAPAEAAPTSAPVAGGNEVKKGMSEEEVAKALGQPSSTSTNGPVTTQVFASAGTEVDLFNGVVVEVRKRAAGSSAMTIKKGLTEEEVERFAGKPVATSSNGPITTKKYKTAEGILEADYVNGIVVGYRTSSN